MPWLDRAASLLDQACGLVSPRWALKRDRARMARELLARSYDAASAGRRTQGWRRASSDANATTRAATARLRDVARDLVRNDPYAESGIATICDHAVGWGIVASTKNAKAKAAWQAWADTTACDADGADDFYGLQHLVMRTVAESGECLVRRRTRRPEDGLPLPFQLEVLEPDYLDSSKDGIALGPNGSGGRIIQGVEFDGIGRRVAYWLFDEHPGANMLFGRSAAASRRIPAEAVLHIFRKVRPGQVRGVSWFAPVLLKLKDFAEYEDAALVKQKIAACLAVITTDVDGTAPALGATDAAEPLVDSLEPGMILNVPPGRAVTPVQPPRVDEHAAFSVTLLRAVAAGLGVTYEDLTGDYQNMPFSAARMSRIKHWNRVHAWRWRMLIPQLCIPVWNWAMTYGRIMAAVTDPAAVSWTAPPMPMIEPDREGLAAQRNIRSGIMSLSESLRELGYEPEAVLREIAADNKLLDRLGLKLDSDGRYMTQAGQLQGEALPQPAAPAPAANGNGTGERARVH